MKATDNAGLGLLRSASATLLVLGVLAGGCQRQTPPRPTDSKTLQQHADELKKQHQRELQNK
jgi:hypothetical protein